jgi:tRNA 2-selenouridine synthase
MPDSLSLDLFLKTPGPLFDVRSPSEYQQGHIPTSISLPLFSDEERILVGTAYKQQSREHAIDLGLQLAGPKLYSIVQTAKTHLTDKHSKVLCWRGGMRSGFIARLFESIGFHSVTLQGGYKTFRRWALAYLTQLPTQPAAVYILGGLTGSGKTLMLQELKKRGEQVLDLENLARHRGSAFGSIGMPVQPSQEQFENEIADRWRLFDLSRPIWIEDESRMIGTCRIPSALYTLMQKSPLFYLECSQEERLSHLLSTYGQAPLQSLIHSTYRLKKKLGLELAQTIIQLMQKGELIQAFSQLLCYYDRSYQHQLLKRDKVHFIEKMSFTDLSYSAKIFH